MNRTNDNKTIEYSERHAIASLVDPNDQRLIPNGMNVICPHSQPTSVILSELK